MPGDASPSCCRRLRVSFRPQAPTILLCPVRDHSGGHCALTGDDDQIAVPVSDTERLTVGRFEDAEHVGDLVGPSDDGPAPAHDDTLTDIGFRDPYEVAVAQAAAARAGSFLHLAFRSPGALVTHKVMRRRPRRPQ